jgi:hypothetical protein
MTNTNRRVDNTSEVQSIIEEAVAHRQPAAFESRGYTIRRPIPFPSSEGLHVQGEHLYGTRLIWAGDDEAVFYRPNSRDGLVENLTVEVTGACNAVFVDTNLNYPSSDPRHDPTMTIPSNNQHRRLRINGNGHTNIYRECRVGNCDENNEAHSDIDVHVNNVRLGWSINGSQAKYQEMQRCRFNGGAGSLCAVEALHGSFSWLGGGGSHASVAFFRIRNQADTIAIHRADVETCRRFAIIEGPDKGGKTGSSQSVEIAGGRFMTDALHPDSEAIICSTAGPLILRNFQLGNGTQRVGCIAICGFRCAVDARGCDFASYGSSQAKSFDYATVDPIESSIVIHPNVYHRADGESYVD